MRSRRLTSWLTAAAVGAAAFLNLNCGGGDGNGPSFSSVEDIITAIAAVNGGTVTTVHGAPPAESTGPTVTVTGGGTVINGGSSQVTVDGSAAFTRIIVYVQGKSDYYLVTLPNPVTSADLLLSVAQNLDFFASAYGLTGTRREARGTRNHAALPGGTDSKGTGRERDLAWEGEPPESRRSREVGDH